MKKLRVTVNNQVFDVTVEVIDDAETPSIIQLPEKSSKPVYTPQKVKAQPRAQSAKPGEIVSPMAGSILEVAVSTGDTIHENQTLILLEAMKMETSIRSYEAGTIAHIHVKPGDVVTEGQILVSINP